MKSLMLLVEMSKPQNHCQMLQQKSNLKQLYTKYVLKSENDLTQEQQLKLEAIQQVSPLLADALWKKSLERYLKVHKIGQMGLSL